jgi:transcriptional regulator with XRE-family HTH domain
MGKPDVLTSLGARIRELRTARAWTQEMLAERAGITWRYVSAIERGTKGATIETLVGIAGAMDLGLSELFLGVDRPVPKDLTRISAAVGWAGRRQAAGDPQDRRGQPPLGGAVTL